jgi:hypothetical protein
VEVDRWQAAPSLPSPWSPTDAWAGRLQTLAAAAASSATAGSDVTTSSFVTGALRELGVALVQGNEVVYREALHVYATAGGTVACVGAMVPTVDPE